MQEGHQHKYFLPFLPDEGRSVEFKTKQNTRTKTYRRHNNVFPLCKISSHKEASTGAAHKPASFVQICQLSRTSPTCFQSLTAPEGMEPPLSSPPTSITACQTLACIHADRCNPPDNWIYQKRTPLQNTSTVCATLHITTCEGSPWRPLSQPLRAPRTGPPWGRMGSI